MLIVKANEQQKEWAIKAGAGIAALIFCYTIMINPVFRDISFFRQRIQDSQKRTELYREVQSLKESLDSSESVLATITERSQLLGKISDIAGRTQLHVETLTPRTETDGGYVKLRMEMEGQGSFLSLLKFMQVVEKTGGAIKIRDVSMLWNPSPNPEEKKYYLQVQLAFETFLKQRVRKNNA